MDTGRKIILLLLALFLFSSQAKGEETFKETIAVLQKAVLDKNMPVLNRHIALKGIVKTKIKRLTSRAGKEKSLAAKITAKAVDFGEPVLTDLATRYVLIEFSKSSRGLRQKYLNTLKITKVGEKGDVGYASGSFLGRPALLSAIKIKGTWVIVGAESARVDQELDNLIKLLTRKKK